MGKKWLNIVYKEKNSTRLKKHYREWADGYDSDLKDWGYAYPSKVKQILEKYITVKKGSKILANFQNFLYYFVYFVQLHRGTYCVITWIELGKKVFEMYTEPPPPMLWGKFNNFFTDII